MIYLVLLFVVISVYNFLNKPSLNDFTSLFGEKSVKRPKNFETSLLALSSFIIKADGVINQVKLNYVRDHYVKTYGKENANASFRNFKSLMQQGISARELCAGIGDFMPYPARMKLIVFLFGVAKSDGFVTQSEELEIRRIASYMLIQQLDYMRVQSIYFQYQNNNEYAHSSRYSKSSDYEYEVLGIREDATIDVVKKAYRTLVKKYHPDRIQNGSKEDINIAKEKFQKIQSAYEKIKLERGF